MNDLNNTCVSLWQKGQKNKAMQGFKIILENKKDHLHAFFNFSLIEGEEINENITKFIIKNFDNADNSKIKDYLTFLCEIKARKILYLKKHQIPNHLLFSGVQRNKIIEVMKFRENNKKKMKQINKFCFPLQNFCHCSLVLTYFIQSAMLFLVAYSENTNDKNIKIMAYDLKGNKISELIFENKEKFSLCHLCGNKDSLIFWTNNYVYLIEISNNISLKFIKFEYFIDLIFVKFLDNNNKNFVLAQKERYVKLMEFPSLKTLQTILIFSFENSNFSYIDIQENPFLLILVQENNIKLYFLSSNAQITKESKLKCPNHIKKIQILIKNENIDGFFILDVNSIQFIPYSEKDKTLQIADSPEIENLTDLVYFKNYDLLLAIENNFNKANLKFIHLKDPYLSQNFSLNHIFPGWIFFKQGEIHEKNHDFLHFFYLDKAANIKNFVLDFDQNNTELIKKIWEPEELNLNDIEESTESQQICNNGLIELIEAWKQAQSSSDFQEVFDIAENGKFFWDFRESREIKSLFLELNKKKKFKKINSFSQEFCFSDITQVSAFFISMDRKFIAFSEFSTHYIKILEVFEKENLIKMKNIMEFDYGQNLNDPRKEGLLFSEQSKKCDFLLFHFYNDMKKLKNLGVVIWNNTLNSLMKKIDFCEEDIIDTFGFLEEKQILFCFFHSGKCLTYNLFQEQIQENELLTQKNGNYSVVFQIIVNQAIVAYSDNIIRIFDLEKNVILKLVYLSGEPITSWNYNRAELSFFFIDRYGSFRGFNFKNNDLEIKNFCIFEREKYGYMYSFDLKKINDDLIFITISDENEINIFENKEQHIIFKKTFGNEGGIKSLFWLSYPTKIIVLGESFIKLFFLYWEWK